MISSIQIQTSGVLVGRRRRRNVEIPIRSKLSFSIASSLQADHNSPPQKQPFLIGVSGGTCSGKTTVCNMIIRQLQNFSVVLLNQTSFYHRLTPEELEHQHEYNFYHPDALHMEQLADCIGKFKSGNSYHVPEYDFNTHQPSLHSFREVNVADVIIFEGNLVLHDPRVNNPMNLKIFVDTAGDVMLSRTLKRHIKLNGNDLQPVLELLALNDKFVKPAFDDFVLPSRPYADLVLSHGGHYQEAIDLIVQYIRTKLGEHDIYKAEDRLNSWMRNPFFM